MNKKRSFVVGDLMQEIQEQDIAAQSSFDKDIDTIISNLK